MFHRDGLTATTAPKTKASRLWLESRDARRTALPRGLLTDKVARSGFSKRLPAPKKMSPRKPNLSDSFTKTCLKALMTIGDFKGTGSLMGPAKDAVI
jgi:hypothetical protein